VSKLPLRLRFNLVVTAIAASVLAAFWWLTLQIGERPGPAAFWFALSGVVLVTLLVDRAADLLMYRRLAQMRQTMQRTAAGDLRDRVAVGHLDEIGVVARGLNDILEGIDRLNKSVDIRVAAATADLRQQSEAIADSHREMAILSEELARAGRLAALGQAAANMAHQIGTPLNLISGYVQLLVQSSPPGSASLDRLKAIQEQVAKVAAIVRSALDSSRPPTVPHEVIDLGDLVRRVCRMAQPIVEEARVKVDVTTPAAPANVLADPVQLELALLNLISNSVDAMTPGGRLTLRLAEINGRLQLAVEDTGSGISPELMAHIFDPWVTTKTPDKGSGLGLSIAKQVVARHGGTISVESRPGRGALFTIELPAANAPS
jgi:two-component system, NtrC family, sensor kinase